MISKKEISIYSRGDSQVIFHGRRGRCKLVALTWKRVKKFDFFFFFWKALTRVQRRRAVPNFIRVQSKKKNNIIYAPFTSVLSSGLFFIVIAAIITILNFLYICLFRSTFENEISRWSPASKRAESRFRSRRGRISSNFVVSLTRIKATKLFEDIFFLHKNSLYNILYGNLTYFQMTCE